MKLLWVFLGPRKTAKGPRKARREGGFEVKEYWTTPIYIYIYMCISMSTYIDIYIYMYMYISVCAYKSTPGVPERELHRLRKKSSRGYIGAHRDSENRMETTMVYWGYTGIIENGNYKGLYGYLGLCWGYITYCENGEP